MADESSADEARETLDELRRLRARSRRVAQAGRWFPASLLAGLLLASTVLYTHPFTDQWQSSSSDFNPWSWFYPYWAGLPGEQRHPTASYLFWFAGIPLVVLASGWWYRRRQRLAGVRVAWQRYALITIGALALLAALTAIPVPTVVNPAEVIGDADGGGPYFRGLLTPLIVVAIATVALGWTERSRGLLFAGGWLAVIAGWQCTMGMGALPRWAIWILNGGRDPVLGGGQWTLFGLHRPGPTLILMALPLLAVAVRTLWRTRRPVPAVR